MQEKIRTMKNIHVLPTDKPSRLYLFEERLILGDLVTVVFKNSGAVNQNIYITSDEELVLGGYHFNSKYGDKPQKTNQRDIDSRKHWEEEDYYITKIVLTTDQDLIKDGVQAIDDEFLEWFVKNPSCEWVEVKKIIGRKYKDYEYYKQWHLDKIPDWAFDCKIIIPKIISQKNMKNKSIEHNATKFADKKFNFFYKNEKTLHSNCKKSFIEGAKWQQEQIGKSEFLQKLRATKSDAEARRLIFEQFKNK